MIRDKDLRETPYLLSIENNDTTYTIDVSNVGNPTEHGDILMSSVSPQN